MLLATDDSAGLARLDGRAMTPAEARAARQRLGYSTRGLAERLGMGPNGGRQVRRWEAGDSPPTGPAIAAIQLLLWLHEQGIDDPYATTRDFRSTRQT